MNHCNSSTKKTEYPECKYNLADSWAFKQKQRLKQDQAILCEITMTYENKWERTDYVWIPNPVKVGLPQFLEILNKKYKHPSQWKLCGCAKNHLIKTLHVDQLIHSSNVSNPAFMEWLVKARNCLCFNSKGDLYGGINLCFAHLRHNFCIFIYIL